MTADATIVSLRSDTAEAPAARRDAPREQPERPPREQPEQPPRAQTERPVERSSEPEKAPQSPHRRWVRWVSFALLPLALIAGGYWYVTGGQVMSMDGAYVEADKVCISPTSPASSRKSMSRRISMSRLAGSCTVSMISRFGSR